MEGLLDIFTERFTEKIDFMVKVDLQDAFQCSTSHQRWEGKLFDLMFMNMFF